MWTSQDVIKRPKDVGGDCPLKFTGSNYDNDKRKIIEWDFNFCQGYLYCGIVRMSEIGQGGLDRNTSETDSLRRCGI